MLGNGGYPRAPGSTGAAPFYQTGVGSAGMAIGIIANGGAVLAGWVTSFEVKASLAA